MIQLYDCKEKLDAGHSQGLESETHSIYKTFRQLQLQLFPTLSSYFLRYRDVWKRAKNWVHWIKSTVNGKLSS